MDQDLISGSRELFEQMNSRVSQEEPFLLKVAQDLDRRARGQVNRINEFNNVGSVDDTAINPIFW